ncbi:hypothetical protein DUNSADRAFT_15177 [Dunaliella salina]|uniref:Secreted protein n=1 Tax=Dunaliella salina TaxID=3046 RepID=A0ABQ7G5X9_DUNSA|nr:hypothetical protein DUNSADRAFT_15177 [Dunaliella salina]|eukprot:KAF5830003.1 hypothetical protein DUNSADRAFT_15177 [Dunaliella salina]
MRVMCSSQACLALMPSTLRFTHQSRSHERSTWYEPYPVNQPLPASALRRQCLHGNFAWNPLAAQPLNTFFRLHACLITDSHVIGYIRPLPSFNVHVLLRRSNKHAENAFAKPSRCEFNQMASCMQPKRLRMHFFFCNLVALRMQSDGIANAI